MDRYNSRNASVGMVALAAMLVGVWETEPKLVSDLVRAIFGERSEVYVAIIAAIFTVFGLPALGSVFDYLSNPFAKLLRRRADSFPNMVEFGNQAREMHKFDESADPRGVYHMIMYMKCDDKILDWAHRRRNRTYASSANILAVLFGVIGAYFVTNTFPCKTLLIFVFLVAPFMVVVFFREQRLHDELIEAWWKVYLDKKLPK